jgi:hypothetical protein
LKFIKTYEEYKENWRETSDASFIYHRGSDKRENDFKFKIGDFVKIVNKKNTLYQKYESEQIYEIFLLDPKDKIFSYRLVDINDDSIGCWIGDHDIEIAQDYEVSAYKYNL